MEDERWLSLETTVRLISELGELRERLVLVGGQAVAVWAERYRSGVPALESLYPLVSRDADFFGGPEEAEAAAERWGGRVYKSSPFDDATPNTAVVVIKDDRGEEIAIDFLKAPLGLDAFQLRRMSVPLRAEVAGQQAEVRVMHPLHCLRSRVVNTARLDRYRTTRSLKQLRASIFCMRAFTSEALDGDHVRPALNLNEGVFRFAFKNRASRDVALAHGIEPFDAVLPDERLPEKFLELRYPKMQEQIARKRRR